MLIISTKFFVMTYLHFSNESVEKYIIYGKIKEGRNLDVRITHLIGKWFFSFPRGIRLFGDSGRRRG
jgi:hypothetical protein